MRKFAFLRWAVPLQHAMARCDVEAVEGVIGPPLRQLFLECDAAVEGNGLTGLIVYSSQANALVATLGALGLSGELQHPPNQRNLRWPHFGAFLEIDLIE